MTLKTADSQEQKMSRKKLLMGNWKMNNTVEETLQFASKVNESSLVKDAESKGVILAIAPTYLSLQALKQNIKGVYVSAQDCHYAKSGAYTSSVSVDMLKEIGVNWSIIGHSEKRQYEAESDFSCNRKIRALLKASCKAVYCVGESLKEYEEGITKDIILSQVTVGLQNISCEDAKNIIIAYEPVWSIGTGKNASSEIAQDICCYIRSIVENIFNKEVASEMLILYGGSVKPENIHNYLTCPDVDGALVGGASLKVESFKALVENI